jgi:hypothetical protein
MAGFGVPFRPQSNAAVTAGATPASGNTAEAIWHQLYDTQLYTSGATLTTQHFLSPGVDPTLSNMTQAGTLPSPQTMQIYDITLDILSLTPVSISAAGTVVGVLNDFAFLIFGSLQRPTWTLTISQKAYGPYSLTVLHGTGGPTGWFAGTFAATTSMQYARNEPSPGWNYYGRVSILQQMQFSLTLNWAAFATLTGNVNLRVSMFGVLNRRVL